MDAAPRAKPELVERIARLAAETDSSPEELAAALDDYRARVEALRALIDEGLNSGEPGTVRSFSPSCWPSWKARPTRATDGTLHLPAPGAGRSAGDRPLHRPR